MQNNDCIHDFSKWKKDKEPVIECESMEEDSPVFMGIGFTRRCRLCGYVDTKIEKVNETKNKRLGLKMKRRK